MKRRIRFAFRTGMARAAAALLVGGTLTGCASGWLESKLISEEAETRERRDFSLHAYDEGLRFAEAGNHELALERFNRSIAIEPRAAAHFQRGRSLASLGESELSALSYAEALRAAPDFGEARLALIEAGFSPPEPSVAEADSGAMTAFLDQVELEVRAKLLETDRLNAGQTDEERAEMQALMRKRISEASAARLPTASEVQAVLFPATGEELEAMPSATDPMFTDDRTIILNTYPYHFANGQRFQQGREYEKAAIEYELALRIDPSQIEARLNLGDCMLRLERYPQARFHYASAMEEHPDSPLPLFKMGNYNESIERIEEARNFYRQAIAKDSRHVEAYNNLAALEIRQANYDTAIQILKSALEIQSDYTLALLNLGVAYENSGDRESALDTYRRYVELGGEQAAEVSQWIAELE